VKAWDISLFSLFLIHLMFTGEFATKINRKWVELQIAGIWYSSSHIHSCKRKKKTRQNSYEMCGRVLPMRVSISRDFRCTESQLDLSCSQHHITNSELSFIPLSHISSLKDSFAHVLQRILSLVYFACILSVIQKSERVEDKKQCKKVPQIDIPNFTKSKYQNINHYLL